MNTHDLEVRARPGLGPPPGRRPNLRSDTVLQNHNCTGIKYRYGLRDVSHCIMIQHDDDCKGLCPLCSLQEPDQYCGKLAAHGLTPYCDLVSQRLSAAQPYYDYCQTLLSAVEESVPLSKDSRLFQESRAYACHHAIDSFNSIVTLYTVFIKITLKS